MRYCSVYSTFFLVITIFEYFSSFWCDGAKIEDFDAEVAYEPICL